MIFMAVMHDWQYSNQSKNNENIRHILKESNQRGFVGQFYARLALPARKYQEESSKSN